MIKIESVNITPRDFLTQTNDYLLGVKDDRIQVIIQCVAEWYIQADANKTASFSGQVISIKDADGDPVVNAWTNREFRVGDLVTITGSVSNNVSNREITAISDDGSEATFSGAPFVSESASTGALLNGVTPLTGVTYKYNFLENSAAVSFNSLVDGAENKYVYQGLDTSLLAYTALTHQSVYNSNKIGTVEIKSTGVLNQFLIRQYVNIVPFCLAGQLSDIQDGIAPEYYFDTNCLNFIYSIALHKELLNPNFIHSSSLSNFNKGNTGNFDQNFNEGPPEYTLVSTVYKNADGDTIDAPDYSKVNTFEITIASANSRFTNTDRVFTVQHSYIPTDSTEYQKTSTDMEYNFMFDQLTQLATAPSVDGRGYGTSKQVLKDVTITFLSASQAKITGYLDLSTEYKARLADSDGDFYLSVTTEDPDLDPEECDRVNVLASSIAYTVDLSDATSGTVETVFFPHGAEATTDAEPLVYSAVGSFVEDWQIGRTIFSVDYTNDATLKEAAVRIYAEHATYGSFNLEAKVFDLSAVPVVSGIQVVSIEGERGYKMASGLMFNEYSITRRADLDAGGFAFYEMLYAFKIRWEDFIALPGASAQFYDPAEPKNGQNNDWNRYFAESGWSLYYEAKVTVTKDDYDNEILTTSDIVALDYGAATDWTYDIKVYDYDTNIEITGNVMADRDMLVEAYFTKTAGSAPDLDKVTAVIGIAPTDAGGDKIIQEISYPHGQPSVSPWVSLTGDSLLKIEKSGSDFTLSAKLDYAKFMAIFPSATSFDITARIDDNITENQKLFGDGSAFVFGDGEEYEFGL